MTTIGLDAAKRLPRIISKQLIRIQDSEVSETPLEFLHRVPLFSGISLTELEKLSKQARIMSYCRGQTIYLEGDNLSLYSIVVDGKVKVYKQAPSGRLVTLTILDKYQTLGDMVLFDHEPLSVSMQAVGEVILLCFEQKDILSFSYDNPVFALRIISVLAQRYKQAQERIVDLVGYDIRHRVPKVLLELFDVYGNVLTFSHQELADILGTNRENTCRNICHLKQIGAIQTDRCSITLRDRAKLDSTISNS